MSASAGRLEKLADAGDATTSSSLNSDAPSCLRSALTDACSTRSDAKQDPRNLANWLYRLRISTWYADGSPCSLGPPPLCPFLGLAECSDDGCVRLADAVGAPTASTFPAPSPSSL